MQSFATQTQVREKNMHRSQQVPSPFPIFLSVLHTPALGPATQALGERFAYMSLDQILTLPSI